MGFVLSRSLQGSGLLCTVYGEHGVKLVLEEGTRGETGVSQQDVVRAP